MGFRSTLYAIAFLALVMLGCQSDSISTFDDGASQIKEIQGRYGVDFVSSPKGQDPILSLQSELTSLSRKVEQRDDTKALSLLLEYRIGALEADRLLLEGFKWGEASTTAPGFGCKKGNERILNSSKLREESGTRGIEAAESLSKLINDYPEKASSLGLTIQTVVNLNANYGIVLKQALKDRDIVMDFCFDSEGNPKWDEEKA
ncbi:MAG TPA: hypothetical protein VJB12_04460 [Candidatus Nanoarchaeia archaeon]|nr:hypothetical protein [Candidatus Nanoarchaeia archaeon]